MSLNKNCVLVNLTIRTWIANKQDTGVAAEVAQAKGVEDVRLGRYWKSLLPKCAEVDKVNEVISQARHFHYANTLAYMHDGPRILPTTHYEAYQAAMGQYRVNFNLAVNALIATYDALKETAKEKMGSLYNEMDYPDKEYVRSRYGIDSIILPLPVTDSLLEMGFEADIAKQMKERVEAELATRFQANARALWDQLAKNVDGLLKTLGDPKKSVQNKSLDASRRMAALLPKLNVVADARLDTVCARVLEVLNGVSHAGLGTNLALRDKVTSELRTARRAISASMALQAPTLVDVEEEAPELTRVAA